tara:strand:- start:874 stop:1053 length:180 start_codon:yes stop_codon:yes gene_type:complete
LQNAASVAGMILTTECALIDIKKDNGDGMPRGNGWQNTRNDVTIYITNPKFFIIPALFI